MRVELLLSQASEDFCSSEGKRRPTSRLASIAFCLAKSEPKDATEKYLLRFCHSLASKPPNAVGFPKRDSPCLIFSTNPKRLVGFSVYQGTT